MEKTEEIPIFYLYLHLKIWEMAKGRIESEKNIKTFLFQWKIPKNIRPLILKELLIMGLLKKAGRYQIEITRPKFSDEELSYYYHKLNIY